VNEIVSHFIMDSFLDPNDERVLEAILSQPIAGTPLTLRDIIKPGKAARTDSQESGEVGNQQPEEMAVQPQDERVSVQNDSTNEASQ